MLRRTFLSVPAFAAAAALVSCERHASKSARMKLRVSTAHNLSMCPFYLAYESGYFADAGFDIEVMKDLGTAHSLPLLAGGKLDASLGVFGPSVVNAVVRGARVRLVAAREVLSPSCGTISTIFASRKAFPQGVRNMRQLRGARIGIGNNGTWSGFALDTLLRHEGMRLSDVVVRKMPDTDKVAALHAGGIDAFLSSQGDLNPELRPLGLVAGPSLPSLLPNFQYSYIFFGSRLLDGPVETGARFLHAHFRGARDYLAGRTPQFLEDYAKQNNLDPKLLREACRATFERDGNIHPDDMRRYIEWMAANGMCPANVDVTALVDTRFLEAARKMK
ncbi:MAG: ABC transporter substrate-binding protein [Bryobacteraceae bacterium]